MRDCLKNDQYARLLALSLTVSSSPFSLRVMTKDFSSSVLISSKVSEQSFALCVIVR